MIFSSDISNVTKEELYELWVSVGWLAEAGKIERVFTGVKNSSKVYLARTDEGRLVGLLSSLTDGYNVYVSFFLINDAYQNKGIGNVLIHQFLEDYSGYKIMLLTGSASKYYEKHGFIENRHGMTIGAYAPEGMKVSKLMYQSIDGCKFSSFSDCVDWNDSIKTLKECDKVG